MAQAHPTGDVGADERQAVLEIVGLVEIWLRELPPSRTRRKLELASRRLERHARKRWGPRWASDAIVAFDPSDRVFHLREGGHALCLTDDADDDDANLLCEDCAAVAHEAERGWTAADIAGVLGERES